MFKHLYRFSLNVRLKYLRFKERISNVRIFTLFPLRIRLEFL